MTYSSLVSEIRNEGQIEGDSDWTDRLIEMINDIVQKLEIEVEDPSRYVAGYQLDVTAQVAGSGVDPRKTITLPTDFLKLDFVTFATTTLTQGDRGQAGYEYPLAPSKEGIVPPAPIFGYPKAFNIYGTRNSPVSTTDGQPRLQLIPAYTLTAADRLIVNYWRKFDLTIDGSKTVLPSHWIPVIKEQALVRVQRYMVARADQEEATTTQESTEVTGGLQKTGQMKTNSTAPYAPTRT